MSNAFDKVMARLEDAQAYLQGPRDGYEVGHIRVPEPNVPRSVAEPAFRSRRLPEALAFLGERSRTGSKGLDS